jgi:uncharacterized protein
MDLGDERHLPGRRLIEAYGGGGFRLPELSHRGSLMGLPSGMWAWPYRAPSDLDEAAFTRVFRESDEIDLLLVGMGPDVAAIPRDLREALRARSIAVEVMATGAAVRTWNVLVGEGRRVAAALLAVG